MAQPRPLQRGGELVGEVVPVACDQGPDKAGHVLWKGGVDAGFQGFGRPGGKVLRRNMLRALRLQAAVCLGPEEDAFGGVIGNLLPGKGAVSQGTVGHGLHLVAGAQVRPLSVCIKDGGYLHPALCLRPDQYGIAAKISLLRPVGRRGGQPDGAAVQVPGGLEEYRHIQGRPQKAAGQAGQDQ